MADRRGSYLATHFLLMQWACEGPPKTTTQAALAFSIRYDRAIAYMAKMEQLGILKRAGLSDPRPRGGRQSVLYVPTRVLVATDKGA